MSYFYNTIFLYFLAYLCRKKFQTIWINSYFQKNQLFFTPENIKIYKLNYIHTHTITQINLSLTLYFKYNSCNNFMRYMLKQESIYYINYINYLILIKSLFLFTHTHYNYSCILNHRWYKIEIFSR